VFEEIDYCILSKSPPGGSYRKKESLELPLASVGYYCHSSN
jgi:hypothetical protein